MTILGVDKRSMPSAYHQPGSVNFKVVLVERDARCVMAYRGIGTPEWIANHGDKLTLKEAACHFPQLQGKVDAQELLYREE